MNNLISHIEYLLHEHNCVIVPNLGGFVVNTIPSARVGVAEFSAPQYDLVFNRDLTHNDGLLAESYMKAYGYSFEKASQRIEADSQLIRQELINNGVVELGKLGRFVMHADSRFVYEPARFVRPESFGLQQIALRPIIQTQHRVATPKRSQFSTGKVAVAAVAVIAIISSLFLIPFGGKTSQDVQNAQIISEKTILGASAPTTTTSEVASTASELESNATESVSAEESVAPAEHAVAPVEPVAPQVRYYIIAGVYQNPEVAQQAIENIRAKGFVGVGSLPRSNRMDVYMQSFTDEQQAAEQLRKIHREYPEHQDAWILKR